MRNLEVGRSSLPKTSAYNIKVIPKDAKPLTHDPRGGDRRRPEVESVELARRRRERLRDGCHRASCLKASRMRRNAGGGADHARGPRYRPASEVSRFKAGIGDQVCFCGLSY